MEKTFDFEKEYGIVLEGGGAKGAYQIGVWKALVEHNVKIKGVAGVSVGSLNGALICMEDLERATKIWENICYSQIINMDEAWMKNFVNGKPFLQEASIGDTIKNATKILLDGGFDVKPLKDFITNEVDEEKIRNSPIDFMLSTFSVSEMKEVQINAKKLLDGELKDYLLASSYFPGFKNEKLGGKKYVDGGVINNIPIDILIKQGYKNIIVIRIFGLGLAKPLKIPEGVEVIEIAPKVSLGKILEFDCKRCQHNMTIGYYDGLRVLTGLKGKSYYLNTLDKKPKDYFDLFSTIRISVIQAFLQYLKIDVVEGEYQRQLFETILPTIAIKMKLEKNWTYEILYISMLELLAKKYKITKYTVYTTEQLLQEVQKKATQVNEKEEKNSLEGCIQKLIMDL